MNPRISRRGSRGPIPVITRKQMCRYFATFSAPDNQVNTRICTRVNLGHSWAAYATAEGTAYLLS